MLPKIITTGLVSADMIRREPMFLFQIQKAEVEAGNYDRIGQLIGELNKARRHGRSKVGLPFAYDDDPRELFEIHEVCQYVERIFEICPHMLYFLLPDPDAIRCFIWCMLDAKIVSRTARRIQTDVSKDAFGGKIKELSDSVVAYGAKVGDLQGARMHLAEIGL